MAKYLFSSVISFNKVISNTDHFYAVNFVLVDMKHRLHRLSDVLDLHFLFLLCILLIRIFIQWKLLGGLKPPPGPPLPTALEYIEIA